MKMQNDEFPMDTFFEDTVKKYFDFLCNEYKFHNPILYNVAYELHAAYIKDDFFINIAFDGNYWCTIDRSQKYVQRVLAGETEISTLDYRKIESYDLSLLDTKETIYNSIQNFAGYEKELFYYATLLKSNPEILDGNLEKFTFRYSLLRKLGFK